jgi:hypothetical protein
MSQEVIVHGHMSLLSHQESGKENVSCSTTPPLGTCCHASFSSVKVFTILTHSVTSIFHIYVDLHRAGEFMVGVAERDPAMVVLATEVRTRAGKRGMVVGGAKVA